MQDKEISILIVEDERPVRALLTSILDARFQCLGVDSAGEAIGLMDSRSFHLAIVDIGLPGMSGLTLCRLIVNRSPGTAVIVISGNSDDQSVAEAMTAGATDYISKPFNVAHVIATVERAVAPYSTEAVA